MNIYKIQLYRYRRSFGYGEELVIADFAPAKVNGFGVVLNKVKSLIKKVK